MKLFVMEFIFLIQAVLISIILLEGVPENIELFSLKEPFNVSQNHLLKTFFIFPKTFEVSFNACLTATSIKSDGSFCVSNWLNLFRFVNTKSTCVSEYCDTCGSVFGVWFEASASQEYRLLSLDVNINGAISPGVLKVPQFTFGCTHFIINQQLINKQYIFSMSLNATTRYLSTNTDAKEIDNVEMYFSGYSFISQPGYVNNLTVKKLCSVQAGFYCNSGWLGYKRYCYYFNNLVPNQLNWLEAKKWCQNYGGSLLSIEDKAENDFIINQLKNNEILDKGRWIGLNDIQTEKTFVWDDNTTTSFRIWKSNQPDNNYNENCVEMFLDGWNDLSCETKLDGLLCKSKGLDVCSNSDGYYTLFCNTGWGLSINKDSCVDINECSLSDNNNCSTNATCNNFVGGYNCTCKSGFNTINGGIEFLSDQCLDINECDFFNKNNCSSNATCINFVGGYNCTCKSGFNTSNGGIESLSNQCYDTNECVSSNDNNCSANATCYNFNGGYNCTCKSGFNTSDGGVESYSDKCHDINECDFLNNNNCSSNGACINLLGGYNCACKSGFNTSNGGIESLFNQCHDINECNYSYHNNCSTNAVCHNFVGGYNCTCKSGFNTSNGGVEPYSDQCLDNNECVSYNDNICSANATCYNFNGGYNCTCKSGFNTSDGGVESLSDKCHDINECDNSNNTCILKNEACLNIVGSYHCCQGEWSTWSECSESCGLGYKYSILNPKQEAKQSKSCMDLKCPVNGYWGSWNNYESCSDSCGICFIRKERYCDNPAPSDGGQDCLGVKVEYNENTTLCRVNGGWTEWSSWLLCSQPCQEGVKKRYRSCTNPIPKYGGLYCNGNNTDKSSCYLNECKEVTVNFGIILLDEKYVTQESTQPNDRYHELEDIIETTIQSIYIKLNKNARLSLTLNSVKYEEYYQIKP